MSSNIRSSTLCRLTVCGIFQFRELKVRDGFIIVASERSLLVKSIVTSDEGSAVKVTVKLTEFKGGSSFKLPLTSLKTKSPISSSIVMTDLFSGANAKKAGSDEALICAVIDVF